MSPSSHGWHFRVAALLAVVLLFFGLSACSREGGGDEAVGGSQSVAEDTLATPPPVELPSPSSEEPQFVHDTTSQVSILAYHRFEQKPRDALALSPDDLEAQCQQIVEAGIPVISMQDFLAWRRGEKNIPPRSIVITIDDGYDCTYNIAKPIFAKYSFPFTAFVYLNYIDSGGRTMTWAELAELRDAGVEIGSHSVSHASLSKRKGRSDMEFDAFLREEMGRSKAVLEEKLGVSVKAFAYPYGQYGKDAQAVGKELGYEALFTVNGQISDIQTPADAIGRFVIQSTMPEIFQAAIKFKNAAAGLESYTKTALPPTDANSTSAADATLTSSVDTQASPQLSVTPPNRSVITERRPLLSADLSSFGELKPESIQMRLSGLGALPVSWDAEARVISCQIPESLHPQIYSVKVTAETMGGKCSIEWSFQVQ